MSKKEKNAFLCAVMEMPETMAAIARDVWEWIAGLWSRHVAAHAILWWLIVYVGSIMGLLFWPGLDHAFLHWAYWIEPKGVQTNGTEGIRNLVWSLATLVGGAAAGIGLILAARRTIAANDQAEAALTQTKTAFESLVTERFTKAVEQLGHEKRAVRLGALYALERIAMDSPRDRDTIVETLAAYIRELAPWTPPSDEALSRADDDIENEYLRPRYLGEALEGIPRLAIDIEAALKVICRLLPSGDPMREKIDLSQTDLTRLDASHLNLSYMNFIDVNLYGASFKYANLNHTQLQRSVLSWATLLNADLQWANLTLASLYETNLNGAWLSGTSLAWTRDLRQEQVTRIYYKQGFPPQGFPDHLTLPPPREE